MFFRIVAKLTLFLVILSYSALVVYAYLPLETSSTKELVTKDDLFIKVSDHNTSTSLTHGETNTVGKHVESHIHERLCGVSVCMLRDVAYNV